MIPKQFLSDGVIGVALIAHYLIPSSNAGLIYFVLNIPLLLVGWFCVSRRFILYTAYGMSGFSLATAFVFPQSSLPSKTPCWRQSWEALSVVWA